MNVTKVSYQIIEENEGVCLKIWEPPTDHQAPQPYSFMANYTVSSILEAQRILQRYCGTGVNVVLQQV